MVRKEIENIFFDNCLNCSNEELETMYREGYLYEDTIGWNNDTMYGKRMTVCSEIVLNAEGRKYITPNEEKEYKDILLTQIGEVIALRKSGSLVFHYCHFPLVKRQVNVNNKQFICSQCRNTLILGRDIVMDKRNNFVYSIKLEYALLGVFNLDLCHKCKSVYDSSKEMKKEKEEYRKFVMEINSLTNTDTN